MTTGAPTRTTADVRRADGSPLAIFIDSVVLCGAVASEFDPEIRPSWLPVSIPRDQMYFWSRAWQRGEQDSAEARDAGETVEFAADERTSFMHWLFSADDD